MYWIGNVDIHNNVDVRDIVGAKNFSSQPHPPSPLPQISPSAQSCGQNIIVKYNFRNRLYLIK